MEVFVGKLFEAIPELDGDSGELGLGGLAVRASHGHSRLGSQIALELDLHHQMMKDIRVIRR